MGGGFRSQNWRDGWEGGTDGREGWGGCDGNYEVDPVHMAWNGCMPGNQLVMNMCDIEPDIWPN